MKLKFITFTAALGMFAFNVNAWDYEGHHAVNELALASLPDDFGIELTPALKNRIAFLAGEPDRWRNVSDLPLKHFNGPDHYIDLEDLKLFGLTPATLPIMRYDFVADIAKARAAHPEKFPAIDPARDSDHTRELDGFLPWAITGSIYEKLKSDFADIKGAQANIRRHAGGNCQCAGGLCLCDGRDGTFHRRRFATVAHDEVFQRLDAGQQPERLHDAANFSLVD